MAWPARLQDPGAAQRHGVATQLPLGRGLQRTVRPSSQLPLDRACPWGPSATGGGGNAPWFWRAAGMCLMSLIPTPHEKATE